MYQDLKVTLRACHKGKSLMKTQSIESMKNKKKLKNNREQILNTTKHFTKENS